MSSKRRVKLARDMSSSSSVTPGRTVAKRALVRGCIWSVGGWLALSGGAALLLIFRFGMRPPATVGAAFAAGAFAWFAVGLFRSSWAVRRERRLVARCLAGERPGDGAWAALAGRIEPLGEPLRAPLDGSESVAYRYEIGEHRGSGRRRSYLKHFVGVGLAPAQIQTPAGSFRLLTVPEVEAELPRTTLEEQIAAFRGYASATSFSSQAEAADLLLDQWSDADGEFRSDTSYSAIEQVDFPRCAFHQQSVQPGAPVALFGRFSAERGGIVPDPVPARLLLGDPGQLATALRSKIRTRLVLGLLAAGAAAFVLFLVVSRSAS